MSAYKPYPKYKPSGVEWLGEVPEGWVTVAVTHIFYMGRGRVISHEDILDNPGPYPVYSSQTENGGEMGCIASFDFEGDYITWTTDGANAGTVFKRVGKFNCTNVCGTLKAKKAMLVDTGFAAPALDIATAEYVRHDINPKLMNNVMGSIRFALPPLPEQHQIASFLDRECGKLDALQAKQERLIELLKEKRQALISHAVTKGLDPNAKLKPSDIEWLGEVPEGWRVTRLRFVIRELESGVSVNSIDTPADSDQFGVLKTSCVYTREFRPGENKAVVTDEMDRVRCPVKKNCLIISRMNTPELVGAAGFADRDYPTLFLPDRLWQTIFYQPSEEIARYLSFVMSLKGFRDEIGMISTGTSSSMKNIAKEDLLGLTVPLPPLSEQRAIVAHLDEKCGKIDELKAKAERAISLLKERRSALISAVVTGKIDVREEVKQ